MPIREGPLWEWEENEDESSSPSEMKVVNLKSRSDNCLEWDCGCGCDCGCGEKLMRCWEDCCCWSPGGIMTSGWWSIGVGGSSMMPGAACCGAWEYESHGDAAEVTGMESMLDVAGIVLLPPPLLPPTYIVGWERSSYDEAMECVSLKEWTDEAISWGSNSSEGSMGTWDESKW